MTQKHPIIPPLEQTQEWSCDCPLTDPFNREFYVATQAARWGADQELEACCEWLEQNCGRWELPAALRAARRPKPPSLKAQALEALDEEHADMRIQNYRLIRSVLESLPS